MLKLSKVNVAIGCALLGLPLCSLAQTAADDAKQEAKEKSNLEVISVTATVVKRLFRKYRTASLPTAVNRWKKTASQTSPPSLATFRA